MNCCVLRRLRVAFFPRFGRILPPALAEFANFRLTHNSNSKRTRMPEQDRRQSAAHPQVVLNLIDGMRTWKKKVWELAGDTIANEKPDEIDDW